ncbi:hypothetical protein C5748_25770 [Phyllobacterium phragmitis]|uniref:HEPN domain-containing protein n=1 Tax=Phyllobacterium phragmitis TaxID=2670329 RepID=A0A2S9IJH0_9HYPH|nr:hypothetical protein [Phyllobacterium phragmitis]PRD40676.1 hypothetical protein C5748_25770 [Phyllobacterium phragmitis]
MTNVLEFRRQSAASALAVELGEWLTVLRGHAYSARRKADGARTFHKCLEYYAMWLRRYYELLGGVKVAWKALDGEIIERGTEADELHLERIVDCLAETEFCVKGRHPWLSVPNLASTKFNVDRSLEIVISWLSEAISNCGKIAKKSAAQTPKGAA